MKPGSVRGGSAPRCYLLSQPAGYWTYWLKETRCDNCSHTRCCCFHIQTPGYSVQESHYKALNVNLRRRASRRAPAPAPPPSSAQVGTPPAPETCPAFGACICTSGSETRFWPAWRWVWGCGPGALSPGRTGSAAVWSASPARTLGTGRRGPGASCAAWVCSLGFCHSQVNRQDFLSLHIRRENSQINSNFVEVRLLNWLPKKLHFIGLHLNFTHEIT